MRDFITVRRPDKNKLKEQYEHTKDKRFNKHIGDKYPIHVILGDSTYCRIRTKEVYKGQPGEPVVERTTFGWVLHGGNDLDSQRFFISKTSDKWDQLLEGKPYWTVLRITAWTIRFKDNTLAKKQMCTDQIKQAKQLWVRRAQSQIPQRTETQGWRFVADKETGVLKCVGRTPGYRPTYLEDCLLTQKLIRHVHSEIKHLGVANAMAEIIKE